MAAAVLDGQIAESGQLHSLVLFACDVQESGQLQSFHVVAGYVGRTAYHHAFVGLACQVGQPRELYTARRLAADVQ